MSWEEETSSGLETHYFHGQDILRVEDDGEGWTFHMATGDVLYVDTRNNDDGSYGPRLRKVVFANGSVKEMEID